MYIRYIKKPLYVHVTTRAKLQFVCATLTILLSSDQRHLIATMRAQLNLLLRHRYQILRRHERTRPHVERGIFRFAFGAIHRFRSCAFHLDEEVGVFIESLGHGCKLK